VNEMSGRERVTNFFKKEPVDRMPCFSGMGMVTLQAIEQMKIRFAQVHSSAEYLAHSALINAEIYGFDSLVIPYDMCTLPEALGRGVTLYEDSSEEVLYPTIPSKWPTMDDVEIPEDFLLKGRMPLVDEAFNILKSESKGRYAIGGWVLGPFTMAGQLIELDFFLKGTKKFKEKSKNFLSNITDLVIKLAKHYQGIGVDYMNIREMGTGTDLLSPRMWKDMVQPNLKKVFDALESPKILHICGSTDMIIEMMNDCGADALSVDQKNNMSESRIKIGNSVLLLGNFDPFSTLCQIPASEVAPVIKECINAGADAVWPGCDLWPAVKRENVEAYVKAVREYGAQASPSVGRTK